jgi:hypothetical protein
MWWILVACSPETGLISQQPKVEDSVPYDPDRVDTDHDGVVDSEDCEPEDADIRPGGVESCNDIDDDCDGEVDEGFDADDDGYWSLEECFRLEGHWDCDDTDPAINPDAEEICDGKDNDCDEETDEVDADDDGYTACEDCDDTNAFVFEGAAEACDGVDNDCDGEVDEIWDEDGDGWSPCAGDCDDADIDLFPTANEACDGIDNDCDDLVDEDDDLDGDGQATCAGDCDDTEPTVYLGAIELCDGMDTDCDPTTDEAVDADGDGQDTCGGDCDETSASAYAGGAESCDGVDNDCDGWFDEDPSCWGCVESSGYLLCSTSTTWDDAAQACDGLGGWLVEINSSSENSDVADLAVIPTWIGATDAAEEDTWLWTDGGSVSYDSWASGEPDDSGGTDCAITNSGGRRGDWADASCSSSYPFVCEL